MFAVFDSGGTVKYWGLWIRDAEPRETRMNAWDSKSCMRSAALPDSLAKIWSSVSRCRGGRHYLHDVTVAFVPIGYYSRRK